MEAAVTLEKEMGTTLATGAISLFLGIIIGMLVLPLRDSIRAHIARREYRKAARIVDNF